MYIAQKTFELPKFTTVHLGVLCVESDVGMPVTGGSVLVRTSCKADHNPPVAKDKYCALHVAFSRISPHLIPTIP